MDLPFSTKEFLNVFRLYHETVWPVIPIGYLLTIATLILIACNSRRGSRWMSLILAVLWLWTGICYHILFFSKINPAAMIFGTVFILEGVILFFAGVAGNLLQFNFRLKGTNLTGYILMLYALVIYPLFGIAAGHRFPEAPIFPVTPCPLTIFTFGIFLQVSRPVRWYIWLIPLLWSLLGFSAALKLTMVQDYGLLVAGVVGTILIIAANRSKIQNQPAADENH